MIVKARVTGKYPMWYEERFAIPANEKIVMRLASKEDGPIDHVVTSVMGYEKKYKLYKLEGIPMPGIPRTVKLVKTNSDPQVLEDMVFGH